MRAVSIISLVVLFAFSCYAQTPQAIEGELAGYVDNLSKYGSYGGAYDEAKLEKNNDLLHSKLMEYGKRMDVLRYGFPKLKDNMYVATSPDDRFRIYSWDEETGGTMHDFSNVFQYEGKSGKVYTWSKPDSDEFDPGSFYTEVFQLTGQDGPIYLGTSTYIGSTSQVGQSINAFTIDGESLNTMAKVIRTPSGLKNSISFGYDFFSVVDRPERPIKLFQFDPAKQTFRFPIVIEDKKTPGGRVTDRFITYRFNGKEFVKVS